jgi:transposase
MLAVLLEQKHGEKAGSRPSPHAKEAVQRLDALFDLWRPINGQPAARRVAMRQQDLRQLVDELHAWLTARVAKLSRSHYVVEVFKYMVRRWDALTHFRRPQDLPYQQRR